MIKTQRWFQPKIWPNFWGQKIKKRIETTTETGIWPWETSDCITRQNASNIFPQKLHETRKLKSSWGSLVLSFEVKYRLELATSSLVFTGPIPAVFKKNKPVFICGWTRELSEKTRQFLPLLKGRVKLTRLAINSHPNIRQRSPEKVWAVLMLMFAKSFTKLETNTSGSSAPLKIGHPIPGNSELPSLNFWGDKNLLLVSGRLYIP